MYGNQWRIVHGRVNGGVGKYNQISILKRSFWLQGLEYWRGTQWMLSWWRVSSLTLYPCDHICWVHGKFQAMCQGLMYICLWIPRDGKAFFSPKSFQGRLLPCVPHLCPCLWLRNGYLSFPPSFLNYSGWNQALFRILWRTVFIVHQCDAISMGGQSVPDCWAWAGLVTRFVTWYVSRTDVCYFGGRRFQSQSMVVSVSFGLAGMPSMLVEKRQMTGKKP